MVKLTIVGRVSDGLPIAQGPRYVNEDNENMLFYKQKGELILKEICRGALPLSRMAIRVDHHTFIYMVENGICYITLCDSSYPRKLAFHYLQDLQKEVEMFDGKILEELTIPYSLIKLGTVIGNIRKQYIDTRSQANLAKLNANPRHNKEIGTRDISEILENSRKSEILERALVSTRPVSPIWCSPFLEAIALKWTPMAILLVVAIVLLWANFMSTMI